MYTWRLSFIRDNLALDYNVIEEVLKTAQFTDDIEFFPDQTDPARIRMTFVTQTKEDMDLFLLTDGQPIIKMLEDLRKEIECPICYEVINNNELQLSNCGHKFCKTCYDRILRDSNECAVCKKKLKWN